MNSARLQVSFDRNEATPANIFSDHDWVHDHQEQLLAQYGERCIVVFNEAVIGVGDTYEAAVEDAERNLPPGSGKVTPIVELLHRRHPVLRVRPGSLERPSSRAE